MKNDEKDAQKELFELRCALKMQQLDQQKEKEIQDRIKAVRAILFELKKEQLKNEGGKKR